MADKIGVAILAAGEGTRLKMDVAKPLAPLQGRVLVDFPIDECQKFIKSKRLKSLICAIIGHGKEKVKAHVQSRWPDVCFAEQKEQKGTADALRSYFNDCQGAKDTDYTLVICADTPVISKNEITTLFDHLLDRNLDAVAATFEAKNPAGYGRIVRGAPGFHIVEHKDADKEILKIKESNAALYIMKTSFALEHLDDIGSDNKAREFYLTDLFKDEYQVEAVLFDSEAIFRGVNTLEQLEQVDRSIRLRKMHALRDEGVRFMDLENTYVETTEIGEGTQIFPQVYIDNNSVIGKDVVVESGCIVRNSKIEDGVHLKAYSHLEDCHVRSRAAVGPFARLRPGADIGEESKIGNFVELKKSKLEKGVKVSHLSYVGDAEIGEEVNIGCGFITCNYDGAKKHKTVIGKGTFVGSDSQMVAPVNVGEKCFIASSTTVTEDMPDGSFAISRNKQSTKENMAKRFLKGS